MFALDDFYDNYLCSDDSCVENTEKISYKYVTILFQEMADNIAAQKLNGSLDIDAVMDTLPSIIPLSSAAKKVFAKIIDYLPETQQRLNIFNLMEDIRPLQAMFAVSEFKRTERYTWITTQFEMYRLATGMKHYLDLLTGDNIKLSPTIKKWFCVSRTYQQLFRYYCIL